MLNHIRERKREKEIATKHVKESGKERKIYKDKIILKAKMKENESEKRKKVWKIF